MSSPARASIRSDHFELSMRRGPSVSFSSAREDAAFHKIAGDALLKELALFKAPVEELLAVPPAGVRWEAYAEGMDSCARGEAVAPNRRSRACLEEFSFPLEDGTCYAVRVAVSSPLQTEAYASLEGALSAVFPNDSVIVPPPSRKESPPLLLDGILFMTGLRGFLPGDGPLDEMGVESLDPDFHPNGKVMRGFLAEERVIQSVSIGKGKEVWFHPNGRLHVVRGAGVSQKVGDAEAAPGDFLFFREDGSFEKIQRYE